MEAADRPPSHTTSRPVPQYIIVRKCFYMYPGLAEHLASKLLPSEPPSYTLKELYAYADGSVRYTPDSIWDNIGKEEEDESADEAAAEGDDEVTSEAASEAVNEVAEVDMVDA